MGGGKGSSAPAPDPRMGEAANRQIELSERQWEEYIKEGGDRDWLRSTVERSIDGSEKAAAKAGELSDYQLEQMKANDERYKSVAIPFEDKLLEDVNRFDSSEYKQGLVDKAVADVGIAADNSQAQQVRAMDRRGVNPNSGNFAALQTATGNQKALAQASTANATRQSADQVGLATKMQLYGGMKGLAGLGNTNAGLATSAMGLGLNANNSGAGMASGSIATNNATFGSAMGGMSAGVSGLGSYTQLQQNKAQIDGSNDPFASILGAGAKMGAAWLGSSDRRLKSDIKLVGKDEKTGLNIYEFSYTVGDGTRFRGVMADEVLDVNPDAVVTMDDGYMAVNYTALGLEMTEV